MRSPHRPPNNLIRSLALAICFVSAWLGGVGVLAAQAPDPFADLSDAQVERSLELLDEAEAAEAAEDWADALSAYRAMAAIVSVPSVRLREAACHEQLGNIADAARIYADVATSTDGESASEARTRLTALERLHPPTLRLTFSPPSAELEIDGRTRVHRDEGSAELVVEPGEHRLVVSAPGHESQAMTVTVGVGETFAHELTLVRDATSVDPPVGVAAGPVASDRGAPWAAPGTLSGLTLAGAVVTGLFWAQARDAADTYNQSTATGSALDSLEDDAINSRRRLYATGAVTGGVAIAAVVTTVAAAKRTRGPSSLAVLPTRGGVSAHVGFRW